MFEVTKKQYLANKIWLMDVVAPNVARACLPGQFVITRLDEKAERIPLTICDYDREKQTITIVFQTVGVSTERMLALEVGDSFADVVGPLGQPSDLITEDPEELAKKHIIFMAGGVGTAPVYPQVKWMKQHGYEVDVIIGARNKDLLFFVDEMKQWSDHVHVATDDGSLGFHGNVNDCLKALIAEGRTFDHVVAIGPMIMMKFVCLTTKELGIHTVVSMNPIMVDGTGMCGACRLTVGDSVKFACVDGPEFDGHLINFDEAMMRQRMYKSEEGERLLRLHEGTPHHAADCGVPKA